MRINEKLIVVFDYEGIEYTARMNPKQDAVLVENDSWETDVECDKTEKEYGYPYLTLWGEVDESGTPTTKRIHGLLNFENYESRICSSDIKVVSCL